MNGYYCNLASSPPVGSGGGEESKWEGVAVGAATLVRNFSSASQRFRAVERSRSTSSNGSGGGLQAVVRRAFSMRRQPSSLADGYWRIHDDMDNGDAGHAASEHQQQEFEEGQQRVQVVQDHETSTKKTKKKGRIFKACRKILGF